MSVYIKGMEMPKGCAFCRIGKRNGKKMVCPLCDEEWDIHDPMSADHRLDNCLLAPVPPHGDLIDRDAATEKIWDDMRFPSNLANAQFFVNELREMPTIISVDPPKEGEG